MLSKLEDKEVLQPCLQKEILKYEASMTYGAVCTIFHQNY